MRKLFSLVLLTAGLLTMNAETVKFDDTKPGRLPSGWSSEMTHSGGEPRWEVVADTSAPSGSLVLAQLSDDKTSGRFPLAIYEKSSVKDGEVSVRCKAVSGQVDQACGIIWLRNWTARNERVILSLLKGVGCGSR